MRRLLSAAVFAAVCAPAASAQWFEDFDSYLPATQLVGQGGWEEWGPGSGALCSNAQARTPGNSVDINGPSDFVHQYHGYTAGTWEYKAWQYIPSTMTGLSYFIMLNTYAYPSGPYNWSLQVGFNAATGNVEANVGSSTVITTPYLTNQWVEFKVVVDLDQDWCKIFYNGIELDDPALADHPTLGGGYAWTGGVFGGGAGARSIAALDLYANSASSVYYDDFSLTRPTNWHEDFDAYAIGSQAVGQGGWEEWSAGAGALVSNAQARGVGNSIEVLGATDLVHQYSGYTAGKWVYRAWQFVPTGTTGSSYFIMLNDYAYPSGPYSWSMQLLFNAAAGTVSQRCGGAATITMPLVMNQWSEIKVVLDLDQDWVQIYYNGALFDDPAVANHATLGGGYRWSLGDGGTNTTGLVNLAALDLFANNASAVYYDDLSLTPFEFETIGHGCAGSMAAAQLTCLQMPRLGQSLVVEVNNLPQSVALMSLGFDGVNSPFGPLPLDMGAYGMPGCMLYNNIDVMQFLVGAGGVATSTIGIPTLPTLEGLTFHEQAVVLDPSAGNPAGLVLSDAALVRVGR